MFDAWLKSRGLNPRYHQCVPKSWIPAPMYQNTMEVNKPQLFAYIIVSNPGLNGPSSGAFFNRSSRNDAIQGILLYKIFYCSRFSDRRHFEATPGFPKFQKSVLSDTKRKNFWRYFLDQEEKHQVVKKTQVSKTRKVFLSRVDFFFAGVNFEIF